MTTSIADLLASAAAAVPSALSLLLMLLKATCLLLAALAVSYTLQRASAGSRHLVWLVALGALLVLPALAAWSPLTMRVLPVSVAPTEVTSTVPLNSAPDAGSVAQAPTGIGARLDPGTTAQPSDTDSAARTPVSLGAMLLAVWALVALVLLARLAYGAFSVNRIVRRGRLLEHADWQTPLYQIADRLALDAAPRLLRSEDVKMPFASGLFASTIVLPAESDGWSAERRSAVLIHELGHVRRHDLIGHTLGRIACALYWFHPLVWTAARRLRAESERACDDLALVFGARPSDYAEHLLDIVTCVRDHYTPSVALAMAQRKEFEGRMLAILNPELRRKGPSRMETVTLVGSLAGLALIVGAAAPVARTAPPQDVGAQPAVDSGAVFGDTAAKPVASPSPAPRGTERVARQAPARPAEATKEKNAPAAEQPDDERAAILAKTLRTDSNANVRRVAAWGLRRYAGSDAVASEALVAAVGNDPDPEVREMAVWALAGAHSSPSVTAALIKAMRQDKDPKVQATAVWTVGSIGDEAALDGLVGLMGHSDPRVRELAAWAIGSCNPDKAPAQLIAALSDSDRDVRRSVAWALYNIGDPVAVPAIDAAFRKETDREAQLDLIKALASTGEASVGALQRLVTSPDTEIRTIAVAALAGGHAGGPWPWPRPEPRPFP